MTDPHNIWHRIFAYLTVSSVLMGSVIALAQQWVPPDNPDPREIRDEAETDIEEGRLDLAAEKYLWYHENALKYEPSLGGVRLSYALGDWRDLADKYPPALQDMHLVRDRAEEALRSRDDDPYAFQDFVALNDVLRDDGRTIELFKWLDQNNRHLARDVFVMAQDALVAGSEYVLCEKYIVGRNSFDSILEHHERTVAGFTRRYKDELDAGLLESFDMMFARRASFIIAILVNRDRISEAEEMAERALQVLEDESHRIQISDALEGIPPKRLR